MKKDQIDQYDMVLSTEKHLKENATLWVGNAPLAASKNLLSNKITELAVQVALQLVNPTGLTEEKNRMRQTLEDQTFVIGSACCSYASATAKPDLYNRCHYTKTDLMRYRDAELLGICTNMQSDAVANGAALVVYGISTPVLTNYQAAITAYSVSMKNPTEALAKRTTATAQIAIQLPKILEIISTRLDNDIVSMSLTQPAFVETYYNVRAINNSATTTLSLTVTVLEETTNEPIPNADLEIVGENITRKSSDRGYNTIKNLVSGSHHLKVSHPNYEMQTLNFTVVSGETTELVVLMKNISE
jgi:hypothetical protein